MIKQYTQMEEGKLKKLLSSTNTDTAILNLIKSTNSICSFAAYEQGKMTGFIIAWKSAYHPFCTYFDIISIPDNAEIIGGLLSQLEQCEIDYPLQTGVKEGTGLDLFYQENNFELIRKTYLPTINLATISIDPAHPIQVKSINEISSDTIIVNNLASLVKRNYEDTHLVNPIAEFNLDKWKEMIFAEDLIAEGSYVRLDNYGEEVLAYSFLHEGEHGDTVQLGWIGARTESEMEYIKSLVSLQINYAKRSGYQLLNGEFDTTDTYAMEILHNFSLPKSLAWNTYQKKK